MPDESSSPVPSDLGEVRLLLQTVVRAVSELRADVLPLVNARSGDLARMEAISRGLDQSHDKHREHFAWREEFSRRMDRMEREGVKQMDRIEAEVGKLSTILVNVAEFKTTTDKWREALDHRVNGIDEWRNQLIGKLAVVGVLSALLGSLGVAVFSMLLKGWMGG